MCFLEILCIPIHHHFLQYFNLLTLICSQLLHIHFLEHLFLYIFHISAHWRFVYLLIFSLESMSKVIEKICPVEFFLSRFHVEWSDMVVGYSFLFIIVQKSFSTELNVHIVLPDTLTNFIVGYFPEMVMISQNIFFKHLLFFQTFFHIFFFFVYFDSQISHSWQLELIFHVSLLNIVHYGQINQMEKLLLRHKLLFPNKKDQQNDLSNIHMIFFSFCVEQQIRILDRLFNKSSELLCLPIGHFHWTVDQRYQIVPPLWFRFLQKKQKGWGQQCHVRFIVECINVLHNHERYSQFEQSCIEQFTHLHIILPEQRQNRINLLNFALTHTQLVFICVVCQVYTVNRIVSFSQLKHSHLPRVDHWPIIPFHL